MPYPTTTKRHLIRKSPLKKSIRSGRLNTSPKHQKQTLNVIRGFIIRYACRFTKYGLQTYRKSHLQGVIDSSGKNYPTLKKLRVLFTQLFKYALQNHVCSKDYSKFIDISQYKDKSPNAHRAQALHQRGNTNALEQSGQQRIYFRYPHTDLFRGKG